MADQDTQEIADLNLSYLLLAQRMLRQDRPRALLTLGIAPELADMLCRMTLAQTLRLAASNFTLCSFRLSELPGAAVAMKDGRDEALQKAHLAIVMLSGTKKPALGRGEQRESASPPYVEHLPAPPHRVAAFG